MTLGKMLQLGGIDNSPPLTDQSIGRFRVARNVYPTPDNRLIPRYSSTNANFLGIDRMYLAFHQYNKQPLEIIATNANSDWSSQQKIRAQKNGVRVPFSDQSFFIDSGIAINDGDYSQAVTSYRRDNTVYFQIPWGAYHIKYDGVEFSEMGVDTPRFSSTSYNPAGTKFVRVIKHKVDFDNNDVASEQVTFPVLAATTSVQIAGIAPVGDIVGLPGVTPTTLSLSSIGQPNRFRGTTTYQAGTNDLKVVTTSTNIVEDDRIGSYVVVACKKSEVTALAVADGFALALKIKAVSPFLILDMNDAKVLNLDRDWVSLDLSPLGGSAIASGIVRGDREFFSIWASPSVEGVYSYQGFIPVPLLTAEASLISINNPPSLTVSGSSENIADLGPTLNEIYDVTGVMISPNALHKTGALTPIGMTSFQDLLVLYGENEIWLNDFSLGGNFEQFNGSNLRTVGDRNAGRIASVCGTQDFLFVSRERQNYYVSGNIVTGNFRVQEISGPELGAWCNNASINIKDYVVFMSPTGVYQVSSGGRATFLSDKCAKNFSTYDQYTNPSDNVTFKLEGEGTSLTNDRFFQTPQDSLPGLLVGYDEYRELLIFGYKGSLTPLLVLHTKKGEFYEWTGLGYVGAYASDLNTLGFISGEYYAGGKGERNALSAQPALQFKEDKTQETPNYSQLFPVELYTSWMTAGEPSLEKQLLQVKMFGRFKPNGSLNSVKVVHYKDWNGTEVITSEQYFPDNSNSISGQTQYSHKKRLNSDKVLSASVGLLLSGPSMSFELESLELEFNPIQQGVKR